MGGECDESAWYKEGLELRAETSVFEMCPGFNRKIYNSASLTFPFS